jgi:rubrerythrin
MNRTFEKSCKNKFQYRTKKLANEALLSLNIENKTRLKYKIGNHKNLGEIGIYFCEFCGYWHIGHTTWMVNKK